MQAAILCYASSIYVKQLFFGEWLVRRQELVIVKRIESGELNVVGVVVENLILTDSLLGIRNDDEFRPNALNRDDLCVVFSELCQREVGSEHHIEHRFVEGEKVEDIEDQQI